jgi:hypothetical protein
MPASIEDVAKLANVSISTVSRVINRRKLVNEVTCERVEAAIRELQYRPNAFARGLMLRKSGIVGLVLPDLHGEFYSEIIRGANLQAREMGRNLLVSSALPGDDADSWLSAIGQRGLVDGLAVMVSDTLAAGIGPTLASMQLCSTTRSKAWNTMPSLSISGKVRSRSWTISSMNAAPSRSASSAVRKPTSTRRRGSRLIAIR